MTPNTSKLQRNVPFRSVNLPKGNPFLSLRAIPFLIVLAGSLAIQPAVRANPVVKTITVDAPNSLGGIIASPTRSAVYVADGLSNRIAVIDTVANQIDFFIPTANPPLGLGLSPDGNTLYVTEQLAFPFGALEAISLTTFSQLFIVRIVAPPEFPGVSSNGSTVYVPAGRIVAVVGGPLNGDNIFVNGAAVDVVFNHRNTSAYVTNAFNTSISVIDTATGSVTTIPTATVTFGLAIRGNTLYATGINAVYVINTRFNTVIDTINVPTPGNFSVGLPALTPDGAFLYAPVFQNLSNFTSFANTVVVINTRTRKVVGKPITVGQGPVQVAAAANDIYGYSSNALDGTVTVFTLAHLPPGSP
jgi:YVTN family beta-propeller protein